jgi:antitoxin component YwqK of YwqJK toxin-antitoxin module
MKYKSIISNFIESEIVERYYYESGKIEHEVFTDDDVKSALELLSKTADYDKILAIAG